MYPIFAIDLLREVLTRNFEKHEHGITGWMYGFRIHPILKTKQFHNGIDLGRPAIEGTPIFCPWEGTVTKCWKDQDDPDPAKRINGLALRVNHPDTEAFPIDQTAYAHMKAFGPGIEPGFTGKVRAGQILGYMGNTGRSQGAHLHFVTRVFIKGKLQTTDPLPFLAALCDYTEIPTHDVG